MQLPEHESGLRRLVADAYGSDYEAFESLEDAMKDSNAVAVFEGDYGGQIYAVVPIAEIACSEEALERLLVDLDGFSWDDPDGRRIYYERRPVGTGIAGGMGGAVSTGEVWLHPDLEKLHLRPGVLAVLNGRRRLCASDVRRRCWSAPSRGLAAEVFPARM
jgi:hypothetical protein